jgi:hypothetical protein
MARKPVGLGIHPQCRPAPLPTGGGAGPGGVSRSPRNVTPCVTHCLIAMIEQVSQCCNIDNNAKRNNAEKKLFGVGRGCLKNEKSAPKSAGRVRPLRGLLGLKFYN